MALEEINDKFIFPNGDKIHTMDVSRDAQRCIHFKNAYEFLEEVEILKDYS